MLVVMDDIGQENTEHVQLFNQTLEMLSGQKEVHCLHWVNNVLVIVECIHFVVALVHLFRKVIACLDLDMIFFEEIMFLEYLINHERKTCFLK